MPRATEPRPSVGGAMAPEAVAFAGRREEFAQNRLLQAMREAGATERGKIQAQAQIRAAQIGAASRERIAAMAAREADRRAAERIEGAELDRKFSEKMARVTDRLARNRLQMEHDWDVEMRDDRIKWFEKLDERNRADKRIDRAFDYRQTQMNVKAMLEMFRILGTSEKDKANLMVQSIRAGEKRDQERVLYDQIRTSINESMTSHPALIEPELPVEKYKTYEYKYVPEAGNRALSDEFSKQRVCVGLKPEMITSANKSTLENMIAGGQITGSDYQKVKSCLDTLTTALKVKWDTARGRKLEKIGYGRQLFPFEELFRGEESILWSRPEALFFKGTGWKKVKVLKPDEAGAKFWGEEYRKAQAKAAVWRNLRDSKVGMADGSKTTVGNRVTDAITRWEGTSAGEILARMVKETDLDVDSMIMKLMETYKFGEFDIPEDATPYEKEEWEFINSLIRGDEQEGVNLIDWGAD